MDKKAFLAVGLSLVIWMAWQKFYLEPYQQQAAAHQQAEQARKDAAEKQAALSAKNTAEKEVKAATTGSAPAKSAPPSELKKISLSNGNSVVSFSNSPWAIDGWELENFSKTLGHHEDKVTLADSTGFSTQLRLRFSEANFTEAANQNWNAVEKTSERTVVSKLHSPLVQISRTVSLDETGYGGRISYSFHFLQEPPKFLFLDLFGSPKRANDKEGSIFGQAPDKVMLTYLDPSGHHSTIGANLKEVQESPTGVKWLGLDTRYFVMALVPHVEESNDWGVQLSHDELGAPAVRGSLVFPTNGKKDFSVSSKFYFGPKELASLTKVDGILADTIDFGWFTVIAIPILRALKWLYSYLQNYGVAIIVLTFLIKMALFPLVYKSMKSMAKMSILQPQLNALREKYKDDKEKLNVEMMNFMKSNGYNPIGGCLPILLQMPIFFALYRVLFNSMELYQAPFAGWIHDLSSPDPYFVTPVLLTGLMYLQQKLSPNTAADPTQQKMLQIMPLMFGAFMLMLPSGLTIYMVVNSAVSILQQVFLNHRLGIHKKKPQVVAKA